MTLITMIAAPWGVWQCSDKRLTDARTGAVYDDDSVKSVTLTCSNGRGMLTYTGIGAMADGRRVSEWIRDQLVGESRTLEESVTHLRNQASRELAPLLLRHKLPHVFMLGAIFADGGVWIGEIANVERWDGPLSGEFVTRVLRIEGEGFVGIGGVRGAVAPTDLATMQRLRTCDRTGSMTISGCSRTSTDAQPREATW